MKSPGNFLVIDEETTKLLQVLAKIHPYGNKIVLKIIIKFYIKLSKYAKKRDLDPLNVLEDIIEKYLAEDYRGFELRKIQKLSQLIEEAEGSKVDLKTDEISELKMLIKEMQASLRRGFARKGQTSEIFSPEEAAKLLKLESEGKPKKRKDYRELRKHKTARKIEF